MNSVSLPCAERSRCFFALTFDFRLSFSKTFCELLLKEQSLQSLLVVVDSDEESKEKNTTPTRKMKLHLSPRECQFKARSHPFVQNSLSQFSPAFSQLIGSHQVGELTNGRVKLTQRFKAGGSGNFKERPAILKGGKS